MSKLPLCNIWYCTCSMSASGQLSAGMGSLHIGAGRAIHHTVPKIQLCIPRKGIARPQSQFLHSNATKQFYKKNIRNAFLQVDTVPFCIRIGIE
jgi:hypothetical protein